MKRLLVPILFALMVGTLANAGELKISETMIDYGTIKEGPPVVKKIILTNTGDSVLDISNVATS